MTEHADNFEMVEHVDLHSADQHEPESHTENEHVERPKNPRDEAMAAIAKRREEAISRELRLGETYEDEARERAGLQPHPHHHDDDPAEQPQEPSQPQRRAPEPAQNPEPPAPKLRTVEIDGMQYQLTEEQFSELAQLGARTNVAMNRYQQAQAQEASQPRQTAQSAPPQKAAADKPAKTSALTDEEAAEVANRLVYGGKETVAETVKALADHLVSKARPAQPQYTPEQVAEYAKQGAIRELQAQQQLANDLTVISQEFPDVFQSRQLGEFAALQLSHVRREHEAVGRRASNLDCYREACNRVREALGQPRQNSQQTPAVQAATTQAPAQADRSRVLEAKRAAPSQPSPVERRASSATSRPKSGSDIVNAMRKARGQLAL